jgi:Uma2 family endonuclease
MAQPQTAPSAWTIEMLEALPDDGQRYELVEGRLIRMPPPGFDHGDVGENIAYALSSYARAHRLGKVVVGETGWDLTRPDEVRDTVLASDVAFVRADRLPPPPPRKGTTYRPMAPDLVVEVASPSQFGREDLDDKARRWIDRGVRLVWVVWPDRKTVSVWEPGAAKPHILTGQAALDGGAVIPGFRLLLSDIWGDD